ncbi:hypothetical protein BH09PLA1_BH09PLA1_15420 [soil metagenome]
MSEQLVKVGEHVINLQALAGAHWEGEKLFVHLIGGRFVSFVGKEADLLWEAVDAKAVDLATGEVGSSK